MPAPHLTHPIFRHNSLYFESVSDPLAIPGRPLSPSSCDSSVCSDTNNETTNKKLSAAAFTITPAATTPAAAMLNSDTIAFETDFLTGDAVAFLENTRSILAGIKLAQEKGLEVVHEAEAKYVALSRGMRAMDSSESDSDSGVDTADTPVSEQASKCRIKLSAKVDKAWNHLNRLKGWKWYIAEFVEAQQELVAAFESMWEQVEAADAERTWTYEDDREALREHLDEIWSRVEVVQRGATEYAAVPAKTMTEEKREG